MLAYDWVGRAQAIGSGSGLCAAQSRCVCLHCLGASMRAGEGGGASVSAKEPSLNPMEYSLSVG